MLFKKEALSYLSSCRFLMFMRDTETILTTISAVLSSPSAKTVYSLFEGSSLRYAYPPKKNTSPESFISEY